MEVDYYRPIKFINRTPDGRFVLNSDSDKGYVKLQHDVNDIVTSPDVKYMSMEPHEHFTQRIDRRRQLDYPQRGWEHDIPATPSAWQENQPRGPQTPSYVGREEFIDGGRDFQEDQAAMHSVEYPSGAPVYSPAQVAALLSLPTPTSGHKASMNRTYMTSSPDNELPSQTFHVSDLSSVNGSRNQQNAHIINSDTTLGGIELSSIRANTNSYSGHNSNLDNGQWLAAGNDDDVFEKLGESMPEYYEERLQPERRDSSPFLSPAINPSHPMDTLDPAVYHRYQVAHRLPAKDRSPEELSYTRDHLGRAIERVRTTSRPGSSQSHSRQGSRDTITPPSEMADRVPTVSQHVPLLFHNNYSHRPPSFALNVAPYKNYLHEHNSVTSSSGRGSGSVTVGSRYPYHRDVMPSPNTTSSGLGSRETSSQSYSGGLHQNVASLSGSGTPQEYDLSTDSAAHIPVTLPLYNHLRQMSADSHYELDPLDSDMLAAMQERSLPPPMGPQKPGRFTQAGERMARLRQEYRAYRQSQTDNYAYPSYAEEMESDML
jgi:hypothetical protein